ncbi:MAG: transcriptional regulator [Scrofimicrobium sp.]
MAKAEGVFAPIIHAPHRLRICAALDSVEQVEFATLREITDVSESVLSKQVKILEDAGYVTTTKGTRDSRVRTWASFTREGKRAYRSHVIALRAIVEGDANLPA